ITGAPGTGKSTLVDALAAFYRAQNKTLGVIAVDPTSPYTGGAILGDRIRMQAHATDAGIFIRSMATRGMLGGLARATADAARVTALRGEGLEALAAGIEEFRAQMKTVERRAREIAHWRQRLAGILEEHLLMRAVEIAGGENALQALAADVADRKTNPYAAVR